MSFVPDPAIADDHDPRLGPALAHRATGWGQSEATRLASSADAPALFDRAGIVTHYPVSPELPDIFHAYAGPETPMEMGWDTPTGRVFPWRWEIGRREAAFYGTVARGKPTWVAWDLLPALLCLRGDPRPPAALHADGLLSDDAFRIAEALEANGGTLATGELRQAAGFETGRDRRAAYLRGIVELDRRLLLGRTFGPPGDEADTDTRQSLVTERYPDAVDAAGELDPADALRTLLDRYLSAAGFIRSATLARHLGLDRRAVESTLGDMTRDGHLTRIRPEGERHDAWLLTSLGETDR